MPRGCYTRFRHPTFGPVWLLHALNSSLLDRAENTLKKKKKIPKWRPIFRFYLHSNHFSFGWLWLTNMYLQFKKKEKENLGVFLATEVFLFTMLTVLVWSDHMSCQIKNMQAVGEHHFCKLTTLTAFKIYQF